MSALPAPKKSVVKKGVQRARIAAKKLLRYRRTRFLEEQRKIPFEKLPQEVALPIRALRGKREERAIWFAISAVEGTASLVGMAYDKRSIGRLAMAGGGAIMTDHVNLKVKEITDEIARLLHNHRLKEPRIGELFARYKYFFINENGDVVGTNRLPRIRAGKREIEVGFRRNPTDRSRMRHRKYGKPRRPDSSA